MPPREPEASGTPVITDEQRAIATRIARERENRHERRGDGRGWTPNGYSGEQIHRIGILGEFAFHNDFGGELDLSFRAAGDDGSDMRVGGFLIDVKTSTYAGADQYLRVPCERMHLEAIYVAALYDADLDDVNLIRWEYGYELALDGEVRCFPPHNTSNYVKLYRHCRRIADLHTVLGAVP